jgi:deoxyribonuclease-1
MVKLLHFLSFAVVCTALFCFAKENETSSAPNRYSQSFYNVKRVLLERVFYDRRKTLYCNADFSVHKKIFLPDGFLLPDLAKAKFKYYDITAEELEKKAQRMEWEHIVPAQNFGKTFPQWTKGDAKCVLPKGKFFKGRKCAEQESEEFRYMYTDMYNLYPSIGAVNYLRANFNFTQFSKKENIGNTFGSCKLKIFDNTVEPPDNVKGLIARTYLYMEQTYKRFSISAKMRPIIQAWDKKYPVSRWECKRAYRIEKIQKNSADVFKKPCLEKNWYKE